MTYITGLRGPFEAFVGFRPPFLARMAGADRRGLHNCESHHDITDSA
jgi:hypothetical protein